MDSGQLEAATTSRALRRVGQADQSFRRLAEALGFIVRGYSSPEAVGPRTGLPAISPSVGSPPTAATHRVGPAVFRSVPDAQHG